MSKKNETIKRHWEMLRQIPRYPLQITAGGLTQHLKLNGYEVTKRTVERDLDYLSLIFPLMANDETRPYQWSWSKDASSFNLPGINDSEALALVMVEQHLKGLMPSSVLDVLSTYFKSAHSQLNQSAKSKNITSWVNKVRNIQPAQTLQAFPVNAEVHQKITEALLNDKQIEVAYKNRNDEIKHHQLHLMALIQRGDTTYIYAYINEKTDKPLFFALHRIQSAKMLELATVYPKTFNIDEDIKAGKLDFGAGDIIHLQAKFNEEKGKRLRESPLVDNQKIEPIDDSHFLLQATLPKTPQLIWWLLAFGSGVEILGPIELRNEISRIHKESALLYSET